MNLNMIINPYRTIEKEFNIFKNIVIFFMYHDDGYKHRKLFGDDFILIFNSNLPNNLIKKV